MISALTQSQLRRVLHYTCNTASRLSHNIMTVLVSFPIFHRQVLPTLMGMRLYKGQPVVGHPNLFPLQVPPRRRCVAPQAHSGNLSTEAGGVLGPGLPSL